MSETHLTDIRNVLEQNRWIVAEEQDGNDYDISGTWMICRPDGSQKFHLEFEGLDELGVLPINKAYACCVRENKEICAYFAKPSRSWPDELDSFIRELIAWST